MKISILPVSLWVLAVSVSALAQSPSKGRSDENVRKISVGVIPNAVKYDTVRFEVHAGSTVDLTLQNGCVIPHNLVILRPGAEGAVLAAVEAMGAEGMEKHFVPSLPSIVASTRLLATTQKQTLRFQVPEAEGEYPYVCTFPGHWFTMRGVMAVVSPGKKLSNPVRDASLKDPASEKVGDALKRAKITHQPLGTMEKPLIMRTFAPDPGLDPKVFAHHFAAKPGIKYDPKTREDIAQVVRSPNGEETRVPSLIPTQPGIVGAVAVNHGAEFSYVWDSTECRLMYAWRGGFLNMTPYWGKEPGSTREKNYIPKLVGKIIHRASGGAPLAEVPAEAPVFGGYRMVKGFPEFWYTLGSDVVMEKVLPSSSAGFELHVRIEGRPREWKIAEGEKGRVEVSPAGRHREFVVRFKDEESEPQPGSGESK